MTVLLKDMALVLLQSFFVLWMALNTFVVGSVGVALVLVALILGAVQYFRIPRLHGSRLSDSVLDIFKVDENSTDLRKNTIFHKAGAHLAPGNTMEAVQKAIDCGVAGVEIDISVSKDDVCVLFHGPRLEETTERTGFVSELTFEELQSLNVSTNDPLKDKFPVTRIPKLEDCVVKCIENNLLIFFDCKGDATQTVSCLINLYKKYPELYRLGVVCSFYPQTIYSLRQQDSNIITALTKRSRILEELGDGKPRNKELWKRIVSPFMDMGLTWLHSYIFWYLVGNSFVLLEKGDISASVMKFWEKLGVHIVAWTVNCPLERHFLTKKLGIPVISDGLTTEDVSIQTVKCEG